MNSKYKMLLYATITISALWIVLTLWVQLGGVQKSSYVGDPYAKRTALVVYNPDPIYNLDEQVCASFAEGLANKGYKSKVMTVKLAKEDKGNYDLYVFCANTYNWAPDWLIKRYIKKHKNLKNKNVVAITLGSGSTKRSRRKIEDVINMKKARLIDSKSLWLMRPNDETRMEDKNTLIAIEQARDWAEDVAEELTNY